MKQYDIVVLGAGPGGYVAAIHGAQKGASVAIVERESVGGVCLNVGCIPTKTLVRNGEIINLARDGAKRGIHLGEARLDIGEAIAMKDRVVSQLTTGVQGLLKANGVDIYWGEGTPSARKTVAIKGENPCEIGYAKLIIATGSRPSLPPVPGADSEGVLDSTGMLAIDRLPEHLMIIGGGVVGCEFASIFRAYGCKVTVIEMLPRLLANMDAELSQVLQQSFRRQKIELRTDAKVVKIERKSADQYQIELEEKGERHILEGDAVLISAGRKANVDSLNALGLDMEKGFVAVDDKLRSSNPDVYAIGDVTGKLMLAHVASAMGICAVDNCLGAEKDMKMDVVPSCVFTSPEIGAVGLTEDEAREKHGEILVGRFPLAASGKAMAMGEGAGVYKVIADAKTHRLLGAHLSGAGATELVSTAAAYMSMNGTLEDITATIFPHPTLSECLLEASEDALGACIHMPPKKKPARQ